MAIDDNTIYGLYGSQIKDLPEKIKAVEGLARELTSADFNWPENDPDGIALWKLPKGMYYTGPNVKKYISTSRSVESSRTILIGAQNDTNSAIYLLADGNGSSYKFMERYIVNYTTGTEGAIYTYALTDKDIVDNLTSTDTTKALSANQGKVLKDSIGDLTNLTTTDKTNLVAAINEAAGGGGGASVVTLTSADYDYPTDNPTRVAVWMLADGVYSAPSADLAISTSTNVGYGYRFIKAGNTIFTWSNGGENRIYIVSSSSGSQSAVYDLAPPTVVQTTGTSTTDVMSQNAVTSMVFADTATQYKVQLGATTSATGTASVTVGRNSAAGGNGGVAVGAYCSAGGNNSIALGRGASANSQGQFDISVNGTGVYADSGYNNSNYRLLTGLYDPQSAHDAATKGYVDTAVAGAGAATFTTNEWNALWA